MKLFFEGYDYPVFLIDRYFSAKHFRAVVQVGSSKDTLFGNTKRINGVGYCFDTIDCEHIFVLPKNFVLGNKAFGCFDIPKTEPIDDTSKFRKLLSSGWPDDLLDALPLYLYQAIDKYRREVKNSYSAEEDFSQQVLTSKTGDNDLTLLDIILSLHQFYKENQNLFVMVYKQAHSGFNKVQWGKTVRKSFPIIDGDNVVYPLVINKKRIINYDEELLCLYFNTLRYLNIKNLARITVDQPYNLMSDSEFERKLDRGIILKRLKSIKNNYFNERMVRLWDLMYVFASKLSSVHRPGQKDDYLFVRKFANVFEAMVDTILSDSDLHPYLKAQRDGKIIDHLFIGSSITTDLQSLYYIGDSKYYGDWQRLDKVSIYKQYTYAKNVIQAEIDWFYENKDCLKYRDELTEGYNLTPNFFISGLASPNFYFEDHLAFSRDDNGKPMKGAFRYSFQFPNRLFDRDTLFLMHFDVNILFIISAYISRSSRTRSDFKTKAKRIFKEEFIQCIEDNYDLFLLKVKDDRSLDDVLDKYYRLLNGKVFCPYSKDHDYYGLLIMGLERKEFKDSFELVLKLQKDFIIKEYHLGTEPYVYYMGLLNGVEASRSMVLKDSLEAHKQESVLLVDYNSSCLPSEAESLKYISIKLSVLQAGCPRQNWSRIFTSSYIFLYNPASTKDPASGYLLTGTQWYDPLTDMLKMDILPMRLGGEIDLSDVIDRHTKGANSGAFFLRFEQASEEFYWLPVS